ncbi:MAG: PVC-type heme-binding CxxCH protein [Akkermansiaceae bacterium]
MKRIFLIAVLSFLSLNTTSLAEKEARRLEVMFLGSPNRSHQPLDRFMTIRRALGPKGINFTYANQPTALTKDNLAKYDALLVYGNHDVLEKDQEAALLEYSKNGGACVFLHSACGCFRNSDAYIKLLGAQFKSHGSGVFRVKTIKPDHELMKGYKGFECWDETYIHHKHNPDRIVLQKREEEPWTWVRTNGKGRVFYTASGHDDRCWSLAEYQDLIYRGIMWTAGPEKAQLVKNLNLPKLSYFKSNVSIIHAKSWGKPLDRKVPHTHLQNPLPVEDSMKLTQVPPAFELQLFASEPDIINPISINWDDKGRMWAVEAYDYPNSHVMNKPGLDTIKILEDTDNDGKADKVTTFATGLTICTSALPYRDGCIATDGEEMVYLSDTDGDGKSDTRKVLFKGLKIWDTHACTSNLRYGFDNWIYATVGYSGLDIKIGEKQHKSRQGVFRFKPDGSALEILQNTTNNTWGLGFTEEGRVMGSTANNNPSWWLDIPLAAYQQSGVKAQRTPRSDSGDLISPITFDTLQVDQRHRVTAGAGHAIYTARLFPEGWHNQRALICAPTCKLVAAPRLKRNGAGFKTTNYEDNIFASADSWSAPVAAEVGPDGAIYIADWYNSIIQHNVYGPNQKKGKGNAYLTEHRDRKHGRIFRIVPKKGKPTSSPALDSTAERITALSHPNLFWRLTAQRLIMEKDGKQAVSALTQTAHGETVASIHALYLLASITTAEEFAKVARMHIRSVSPGIQLAVIRSLPPTKSNAEMLLSEISKFTPDGRHAALVKIALAPKSSEIFSALKKKINTLLKDQQLTQTVTVALAKHDASSATQEKPRTHPLSASAKRGAEIYKSASCIACHQSDGEGVDKTFPPLNKSEWLSRNRTDSIKVVLKGLVGPIKVLGKEYNGAMPAQENLKDQQIADVLNFARNSWDNKLGDITKEEVAKVRTEIKNRKEPFTADDFANP